MLTEPGSGRKTSPSVRARSGPLPHLIALAHIEVWLAADDGIDSQDVRDELPAAAAKAGRAGRAGGADPGAAVAHNAFAMAFCLADDGVAATEQFALMGNLVSEYPWNYTSKPVKAFRKQAAKASAG